MKKNCLKLNILNTKIVASGLITLWQIDGKTIETVMEFIFLASKFTVNGDCTHEMKRRLLLGRKAMTNLDSVSKSRDITLPAKVRLVKAIVFLVAMYTCELDHKEGWAQKNWWFQTVEVLRNKTWRSFGVEEDSWEFLGL